MKKWMWGLLLLAAWELFARFGGASPLAFPNLAEIGKALITSIGTGDLLQQTAFSLGMILWGLFLALVLALVLATLSIINRSVDELSDTRLNSSHP